MEDKTAQSFDRPSQRRRKLIVTAVCAVFGVAIGVTLFGSELDFVRPEIGTEINNRYVIFFLLSVTVSLISLALLPRAIHHDPRENDPAAEFPGTRGTLIASLVILAGSFSYFSIPMVVVVAISVFSRRSTTWSVAAFVAIGLSLVVDYLVRPDIGDTSLVWWEMLLGMFVLTLPAFIYGTARGRRRERQWRLLAQAQLNEETVRASEEAARQEERQRIARDMHDSLSHRLSLIAVHAGALSYRSDLPAEKIASAAGTIRDEAQAAVEDLRDVLTVLREEESTSPSQTVSAIVEAARAAGAEVTYTGPEDPTSGLSTLASHTLTRAVQEGLTNARKHAPSQPVTLHIERKHNQLHATMSNPSAPGAEPGAGSRQGLIGLNERARLAGGTFEVIDGPQFSWRLSLPVTATQEEVHEQ